VGPLHVLGLHEHQSMWHQSGPKLSACLFFLANHVNLGGGSKKKITIPEQITFFTVTQ
jgi:hypothetical protein